MTTTFGLVLHADFIALSDSATAEHRDALIHEATALLEIDGVIEALAIEGDAGSDFDLALLFVLRDFEALEPFGTDARYVRFLQGEVAPRLKTFAGADVLLDGEFPQIGAEAACIAMSAPAETYDWEIKQRLEDWASSQRGSSVVGLATGEKQRFRGVAVVSSQSRPSTGPGRAVDAGVILVSGGPRRLA